MAARMAAGWPERSSPSPITPRSPSEGMRWCGNPARAHWSLAIGATSRASQSPSLPSTCWSCVASTSAYP